MIGNRLFSTIIKAPKSAEIVSSQALLWKTKSAQLADLQARYGRLERLLDVSEKSGLEIQPQAIQKGASFFQHHEK